MDSPDRYLQRVMSRSSKEVKAPPFLPVLLYRPFRLLCCVVHPRTLSSNHERPHRRHHPRARRRPPGAFLLLLLSVRNVGRTIPPKNRDQNCPPMEGSCGGGSRRGLWGTAEQACCWDASRYICSEFGVWYGRVLLARVDWSGSPAHTRHTCWRAGVFWLPFLVGEAIR